MIATMEANYVELLNTISDLNVSAASDPQTMMDFGGMLTPFALVVFNSETASPTEIIDDGAGAMQQSEMQWSIFLGASSFATDGEGRSGIYALIDDVLSAVQGAILNVSPPSKPFYVRTRRYGISSDRVVYELVFRNGYIRST